MATSSTSEAKAKVTLDSASFEKGAKAIVDAANGMSNAVGAAFVTAGAAVLAAFGAKSIGAVINSAGEVLTLGENLANAGKKAGIAAGQYYLFHNAVEKGLNLKTVAGLIGENAEVLNESAGTFRDVSLKLWVVGEKIRGFWLGLMDRVAPVLSHILDGALGRSLVEAGQWFGDKIADGIAIVYQLAEDGKLWGALRDGFQIAFDYAGERLLWVGKVGYEIFKASFSSAAVDGLSGALSAMWSAVSSFTKHFGEELGKSLFNFWTEVISLVDSLLNRIDSALAAIGFIPQKIADENARSRQDDVNTRRQVGQSTPYQAPDKASWLDIVKDVFSKNQFKPSEDLATQIDNFGQTLSESLAKYASDAQSNPTRNFENTQRRPVFGADELSKIGGGGYLYRGLSVLDIQQSQLQELRDISRKLDWRPNAGQTRVGDRISPSGVSISRSQRGDVTNGSN